MNHIIMHDAFGNTALIEQVMVRPYNDAPRKELAYRIIIMDADEFIYHVSVHDALFGADSVDAELAVISGGTWH